MRSGFLSGALATVLLGNTAAGPTVQAQAGAPVYPRANWEQRSPESLGLVPGRLTALAALVGGRGCVVRHGYLGFSWGDQAKSSDVASAFKPVLTTLLFIAIQQGRIRSVDEPVARFEPRLRNLN
ncbi:MAG: hypothetical protein KGS61_21800, partial [Verrucomicrobia bacterium]|nr:hypothetical protein [Verrucomicrobiota bacterium]